MGGMKQSSNLCRYIITMKRLFRTTCYCPPFPNRIIEQIDQNTYRVTDRRTGKPFLKMHLEA